MIVEQRTYELQVGKVAEYLALYQREGLAVQTKHLTRQIGYFFSEIGALNQIVHMWGYEDLADRTKRRTALNADPKWLRFLGKISAPYRTHGNEDSYPGSVFADYMSTQA